MQQVTAKPCMVTALIGARNDIVPGPSRPPRDECVSGAERKLAPIILWRSYYNSGSVEGPALFVRWNVGNEYLLQQSRQTSEYGHADNPALDLRIPTIGHEQT